MCWAGRQRVQGISCLLRPRMEVGAGRGGQGCRRGQKVEEYEADGVWCEGQ